MGTNIYQALLKCQAVCIVSLLYSSHVIKIFTTTVLIDMEKKFLRAEVTRLKAL